MEQIDMDLVAAVEARLGALNTRIAELERELGETNEALAACQAQAGGRIAQLEKALQSCISAHKSAMDPFASSTAYIRLEDAIAFARSLMVSGSNG